MKLAQQLRKTEAELDKVQRLHLGKSRRLMELEQARSSEIERDRLQLDGPQP